MGKDSAIQWTHHTLNPWRGCTKISAGCTHCYAETLSKRNPAVLGIWGDSGTRVVASEESAEFKAAASDADRLPACGCGAAIIGAAGLGATGLAYYTAKERGCPIDFPRNLAKSVTVE